MGQHWWDLMGISYQVALSRILELQEIKGNKNYWDKDVKILQELIASEEIEKILNE